MNRALTFFVLGILATTGLLLMGPASARAATADPTDVCTKAIQGLGNKYLQPFPILPDELVGGQILPGYKTMPPNNSICTPAQWNRDVLNFLANKALAVLYFLTFVFAVLFTIISGLYYMSGFASEANVKKGKSILSATYIGLFIVLLSRVILYGSYQVVSGQSVSLTGLMNPGFYTTSQ